MHKQIIRRDYHEEAYACLQDLHPILRRVYAARAIKSNTEIDRSLDQLLPYQTLLDIDKAVELIADAIFTKQRILIVGDFDADGATSTALAIRALRSFGATHVDFLVPNRFAFGYGLTPELVAIAKEMATDLIITVDNGIANHAGVTAAKAQGMRVIITDHHLPAHTLPVADAIVNPNQLGDPFPSKYLAGVGVIFYVMLALRRYLVTKGWFNAANLPEPNMTRFLDLVALGTVADLVPLDQNNRILVHHGLRRIRAGQCIPGIVALLELSSRDFMRVVASDLGYAVASRLNAAGRMDDMTLGIECLLSDDSLRAREFAQTLDHLNDARKTVEHDMQTQALAALNDLNLNQNGQMPRGICLFDESWHQGVIGILAARIKDKFSRPVIVFAPSQSGELKGSARSIVGTHIRDVLALIDTQYPNLILKFGGHAMAAGLSIARDVLNDFMKIFDEVISKQVTDAQLKNVLLSDGELDITDINVELASLIKDAGPWGQAFPEPMFDDVFRVLEQRIVGDKHLKLRLSKQNKVLDAVVFFVDTAVWPNHRCEHIRAAYRLDINAYRNQYNVQLIIDYLEPYISQSS